MGFVLTPTRVFTHYRVPAITSCLVVGSCSRFLLSFGFLPSRSRVTGLTVETRRTFFFFSKGQQGCKNILKILLLHVQLAFPLLEVMFPLYFLYLKTGRTSSRLNSSVMHLLMYSSHTNRTPGEQRSGKDLQAWKYRKKGRISTLLTWLYCTEILATFEGVTREKSLLKNS